ncbi:hypothetical protein DXJ58_02210 [Vibrio fluvialis]|nr:hypothetical protein [Vibrio fluvialis]EKO3999036.1 hypothetical protein [Vibrio fluvialis]
MSSETFFHAPREWVAKVIEHLEQALSITISSTYVRSQHPLKDTQISYIVGEVEPINEYSNDGRKFHDIELRFLIEVPTNINGFDLEALDASTRLERELLLQRFGSYEDTEDAEIVSNLPSRFDPKTGVLSRTLTMRQRVRMGPVEETFLEIVGTELNGTTQTNGITAEAG